MYVVKVTKWNDIVLIIDVSFLLKGNGCQRRMRCVAGLMTMKVEKKWLRNNDRQWSAYPGIVGRAEYLRLDCQV
jgi:hypothetical protein